MPYNLENGRPTDKNIIMMVQNIIVTLEELKEQMGEEKVCDLIYFGLYHNLRYEHDGQQINISTLFLNPKTELRDILPMWIYDAFVNAFTEKGKLNRTSLGVKKSRQI